MRHRTIREGVVVLLISACTLVQTARGDGPKTTMCQRLCEQAIERVQSRNLAQLKEVGCYSHMMIHLFGWLGCVFAADYPAEVLLYDEVLDTLVADVAAENKGFELLSKTPESLIVHVTYGADCEMPEQDLLHMKNQTGTRAEISPLLYFMNDRWIHQVDLGIPRTRANVYATVRVRERATQREGKVFLFLSLSLAEVEPGRFHWDRLARTQLFISDNDSFLITIPFLIQKGDRTILRREKMREGEENGTGPILTSWVISREEEEKTSQNHDQ